MPKLDYKYKLDDKVYVDHEHFQGRAIVVARLHYACPDHGDHPTYGLDANGTHLTLCEAFIRTVS